MSISLFISLVAVLFVAPVWTHEVFSIVFIKERSLIALDNAAILLGRNEREICDLLRKVNKAVSHLEIAHHALHTSSIVGIANPEILAQDLKLESLILELHGRAREMANLAWRKGTLQAEMELSRMKVNSFDIVRNNEAPIQEWKCPICHLNSQWEALPKFNETWVKVHDSDWSSEWRIFFRELNLRTSKQSNFQLVAN